MIYDEFTQLAIDQINEYGRTVVLVNRVPGVYNKATGLTGMPAETSKTVKALFTDYSDKEIDGEIIQRGDKKCLIAGDSGDAKILRDGTDEYKVQNKSVVQPGDVVVLSKLQVRR